MASGRAVYHVLGGGALGSLVAHRLSAAGVSAKIVLKAGSRRWERVGGDGRAEVFVTEPNGTRSVERIECVGAVDCAAPRVVVCVKAHDASAAVASAVGSACRARLLLLSNGALSLLDGDARYSAGATTHGCYETAPFDVTYAGAGQLWIEESGGFANLARAPALNVAHLPKAAMAERLWLKLAANCVLNPLTALHRCDNGSAIATPARSAVARAVVEEISAVAGGFPAADALEAAVLECAAENATNFSSMYQDAEAGRRTEIDALNGWVAKRGRDLGVPTPANASLAASVRALGPNNLLSGRNKRR